MREMTSSKPEFKRQESWRYKRVAENWRRPRGVTSKMRKEESGFPGKVKVGYGSDSTTRGLHPRGLIERLVSRETDLESLDPKLYIIRISSRVGERKRRGIIAKAKEHNFHLANPGKEETRPVTEAPVAEEKASSEAAETPAEEYDKEIDAPLTEDEPSESGEDSE
jgi:large subunit ribosomal protein L32e